jgi:hypothetical protein
MRTFIGDLALLGALSSVACTGPSPVVGQDMARSGTGGREASGAGAIGSESGAMASGGRGSGSGGTGSATGGTTDGAGAADSAGTAGTVPDSSMAGTSASQCVSSGAIVAREANNYAFSSTIQLTATKIRANEPDIEIDWGGVVADTLGRPISPTADIDSVVLVALDLTLDEFEQHLNDDDGTLKNYNEGALQLVTNQTLTSGNLQDFTVPSTSNSYRNSADVRASLDELLDPVASDPENHLFAVMPSTGILPGDGARLIHPFVLDREATAVRVELGPNQRLPPGADGHTGGTSGPSMSLTYDVELEDLIPTRVPMGESQLSIDWSQLASNGLGRPWLGGSISRVAIAHYQQDLRELEDRFLELETIASTTYNGTVPTDEPTSLYRLEDPAGNPFPGIDDTGVWLLALFCDPRYCGNPAPWYLTVLEPCE